MQCYDQAMKIILRIGIIFVTVTNGVLILQYFMENSPWWKTIRSKLRKTNKVQPATNNLQLRIAAKQIPHNLAFNTSLITIFAATFGAFLALELVILLKLQFFNVS